MSDEKENPDVTVIARPMGPNTVMRPEPAEMSVGELVAMAAKVQEVMRAVMIENFHYGKIPGCGDKPTLLKPGAEKLALVFRLSPSFDITETDLPGGHKTFRVLCTLTHIPTGARFPQGVGYGSTMESKYRWRSEQRKCPKCGKAAIIKGREEYGGGWVCFKKKDGCGAKWPDGSKEIEGQETGRVENPDIADTYNTVLKMAKKRAQIDATLTATGASDIFAQDLEDLAGVAETYKPAAPAQPQTKADRVAQGDAEFESAWNQANPPPESLDPFKAVCDHLRAAKTVEELDAIEATATAERIPDADQRQRVHKFAGAMRSEMVRLAARPEAGAAPKKKGTAKQRDALLKSLDAAREMEDVRKCFDAIKALSWSKEDGERLTDRVHMRRSDFANAVGER